LGSALKRAVDEFNSAVGSFEGRLLVSARRLKELGAAAEGEVPELAPIGTQPRELTVVPAAPTPGNEDT